MDAYTQIVSQIIRDQEEIIGPVALEQAKKIDGLEIINNDIIKINGNAKDILSQLVNQYAKLFGRASIEICREAVHEIKNPISMDELPEILR